MRGELFSGRYGVVEAFAFTAIVLVDIWFLHWRNPLGDLLPACFILWSLIRHNETLQSLGLAPQQLWPALRAWRLVLLPCAAAVFIGCFLSGCPLYLLFRGAMYFIWCVLQQVLLDNLIYRRLRDDLGPAWRISIIAGSLFAIAHLPNPVLVRSTLAWGAVASRLFEKRRSVIALAFFRPSFPHCFFGPRP